MPVAPSKEARFLMLTWEDDVEVHALRKRGWTISAIARHTGFDRKTVRKYLNGDGQPGVRARPGPDPFDPFVDYVSARLTEDPHLWARTLLDELEELGFGLSYPSLTRNIRQRSLRPVCESCRRATERPNAVIAHTPGDETQWDWLELPIHPNSGDGARPRISSSARWPTPPSGERRCRRRRINRTWLPASTA
jgi:transposase